MVDFYHPNLHMPNSKNTFYSPPLLPTQVVVLYTFLAALYIIWAYHFQQYLYNNFQNLPEGELTKLRASLVCEKTLCIFAKELNLGDFLLLGKGEAQNHGNERASILADAFEAVLAAMFLDGGMEVAKKHVLRFVIPELENREFELFKDYKTALQEVIQRNPEERLSYVLIDESGPDHDKRFTVEVHLNSNVIGTGSGRSKKQAEQQAACQALKLMGMDV